MGKKIDFRLKECESEFSGKRWPGEKPPLGLAPRFIWERERILEILAAIKRYVDGQRTVPWEWQVELGDLLGNIESRVAERERKQQQKETQR